MDSLNKRVLDAKKEVIKGHLDHAREDLTGKITDGVNAWLLEPAKSAVLAEIAAAIAEIDAVPAP